MTEKIDFEAARERDGSAADERSDRIEELLNSDTLGFESGDALAAESYQAYPSSRAELSAPGYGEFLESLLGHHLVTDWDDAIDEIAHVGDSLTRRKWKQTLQSAAQGAGLEAEALLAADDGAEQHGSEDALAVLTEGVPDDAVRADNPLVVVTLYREGLATAEVADLLDSSEAQVRGTRRRCGLLEHAENTTRDPKRESDIRLGGTTVENRDAGGSSGLTVRTQDFE